MSSVRMRVDITSTPSEGLLKGMPVGEYDIGIPDHNVEMVAAIKGGGRRDEKVLVALTAANPQLIGSGDDLGGVIINMLQIRIR